MTTLAHQTFKLDPADPNRIFGKRVRQASIALVGVLGAVESYVIAVTLYTRASLADVATITSLVVPGLMAGAAWWASRTLFAEEPIAITVDSAAIQLEYLRGVPEAVPWASPRLRFGLTDIYSPWAKQGAGAGRHIFLLRLGPQTISISEALHHVLQETAESRGFAKIVRESEDSDGRRTELDFSSVSSSAV